MSLGLYILVPLSIVLVFVTGVIFWWSVRSGQFDDLEGPGFRMLVDDRDPEGAAAGNAEGGESGEGEPEGAPKDGEQPAEEGEKKDV